MTEYSRGGGEPDQSGGETTGVDEDVEGRPDDRKDPSGATPDIGEGGREGQTQTDAPADDTGVPPDDEMGSET